MPHPQDVHELVAEKFRALGADEGSLHAMSETILIREGHYYGRCFRAADLIATLVAATNTLELYNDDGKRLDAQQVTFEHAPNEEDLRDQRAA